VVAKLNKLEGLLWYANPLLPWLDAEMKRQLELKDRPKERK